MTTMKISVRKARESFSEIINKVAMTGERVVITSKNKPKAAIVSLKDMESLEDKSLKRARRLAHLERLKEIRQKLAKKGIVSDSVATLRRIREERTDYLSSSD
jgi:prevent-host-death family protein